MLLIGLSGSKYSGKDTIAKYLVDKHDFDQIRLADPIHRFIKTIELDKHFKKEQYRPLMVMMGLTCRKLNEDIFIQHANKRINDFIKYAEDGTTHWNPRIVVSDIRFCNEWLWVKSRGGFIWKIEGRVEIDKNDPAEIGIPENFKPCVTIENDKSKSKLFNAIEVALEDTIRREQDGKCCSD